MPNYMVVKHPCCGAMLGHVFYVERERIEPLDPMTLLCCPHCHMIITSPDRSPVMMFKRRGGIPRRWVIELPPDNAQDEKETAHDDALEHA